MPVITPDIVGVWVAIGLAVGLLAKLFLPGRGWIGSLLVATLGACLSGFVAFWIGMDSGIARAATGLVAFLGAMVALLIYNRIGGESGLDSIT